MSDPQRDQAIMDCLAALDQAIRDTPEASLPYAAARELHRLADELAVRIEERYVVVAPDYPAMEHIEYTPTMLVDSRRCW